MSDVNHLTIPQTLCATSSRPLFVFVFCFSCTFSPGATVSRGGGGCQGGLTPPQFGKKKWFSFTALFPESAVFRGLSVGGGQRMSNETTG